MRVVVDYDLCESNALCMAAAPEVFEVRDDDFLYVLQDEPRRGAAGEGRGGRAPLPQASHHDRGLTSRRSVGLDRIVIVGASLAGLRAAEELRTPGPRRARSRSSATSRTGPTTGRRCRSRCWPARSRRSRPRSSVVSGTLDDLDLDWRLGQSATGLDLGERAVLLGGGERLPFDGLVIATGASPKRLPGTDHLDGVHTLRTLDDCLEIRAALERRPAGSRSSAPASSAPRWRPPAAGSAST